MPLFSSKSCHGFSHWTENYNIYTYISMCLKSPMSFGSVYVSNFISYYFRPSAFQHIKIVLDSKILLCYFSCLQHPLSDWPTYTSFPCLIPVFSQKSSPLETLLWPLCLKIMLLPAILYGLIRLFFLGAFMKTDHYLTDL